MPLDLPGLANDLYSVFSNVGPNSPITSLPYAQQLAQAHLKYVLTGQPTLRLTTFPGAVEEALTASNVLGTGIGGVDQYVGTGLNIGALTSGFNQVLFPTTGATARDKANQWAQNFHSYFSQGQPMTQDTTSAPCPAPPPSGPVTGSTAGIGGMQQSAPGPGYTTSVGQLTSDLNAIFSNVNSQNPLPQTYFAEQIAKVLDSFSRRGLVKTQGAFSAPASVEPLPPFEGSYEQGIGTSSGVFF
jgi:hypothetical protein